MIGPYVGSYQVCLQPDRIFCRILPTLLPNKDPVNLPLLCNPARIRCRIPKNTGSYRILARFSARVCTCIAAVMLVFKRIPTSPFSHIIENIPTSLAHNSVFIDPNNLKFGTETHCMVLKAILKFRAN